MSIRRKAVNVKTFLPVWNAGVKAGNTLDEIAAKLGMEPSSASVAASQRRRALGFYNIVNGKIVPCGHDDEKNPIEGEHEYVLSLTRGGGGRKNDVDALRQMAIDALGGEDALVDAEELETADA